MKPHSIKTLFLLLITPGLLLAETIRFVGSDFMDGWVQEALEPMVSGTDGLEVDYGLKGSFPGLAELRLDEADVGIIAIPTNDTVPQAPLVAVPIAYKVAYILVHADNQLREITRQRLAGIYGAGEETDFTQWGQLGLIQWQSRKITAAIHSGDNSLADSIFKYNVLRSPDLKGGVAEVFDAADLEEFSAKNESAIAVSSRAPSDLSAVRALPVARNDESPGYAPSPETVHFRDYKMILPYYIVYPDSDASSVEPIVRYLLSDRFAATLEQQGFMPLPQQERQRLGITLGM